MLSFSTLSEPTTKTLRYLSQFDYFDAKQFRECIEYVDLGGILHLNGLEAAASLIMQHVKRVKPSIVIIDSFKVFDEMATSSEEFRKFGYRLAVNLMAWQAKPDSLMRCARWAFAPIATPLPH